MVEKIYFEKFKRLPSEIEQIFLSNYLETTINKDMWEKVLWDLEQIKIKIEDEEKKRVIEEKYKHLKKIIKN